jgi:DNA ligase-1
MHFVDRTDIQQWIAEPGALGEAARGIGTTRPEGSFLEQELGLPYHLATLLEQRGVVREDLASIPFHSLCRGLVVPLCGLRAEKIGQLFGVVGTPAGDGAARLAVLERFMDRDLGLSVLRKVGMLMGDPFHGRACGLQRDSLIHLLATVSLRTRRELLDRLTVVGDIAALFAESRGELAGSPALSAAEVLATLELLPDVPRGIKLELLRSLLARCGKLEAWVLAKLVLRKLSLGLMYEGAVLSRLIARAFGVAEEQVTHAMALTDAFHVVRILGEKGAAGLHEIQLQPLVPLRPCLAGGSVADLERYPVWVERKYDGIRLMLHKASDRWGAVLCGAYSRNRQDYLELVRGLDASIKMLPARAAIVDGELHGTVVDGRGPRPATVYEVMGAMQGDGVRPVSLRYAAFDLLYLDGRDLTGQPLAERRQALQMVVGPLGSLPMPVPIHLSEGQNASSKADLNRLYEHFRAQGYEGIITKDPGNAYHLATRDPSWRKRKPEVTLDLVLLGACWAITTKEKAGMFGSYVLGARGPDGAWVDVGDVAGVDQVRDAEIQQLIMSEGLITGRRIERQGSTGLRPGLELRPAIVVTVRFEGITREGAEETLHLRDPKLVAIRADKDAGETDGLKAIEELYLRQRMG